MIERTKGNKSKEEEDREPGMESEDSEEKHEIRFNKSIPPVIKRAQGNNGMSCKIKIENPFGSKIIQSQESIRLFSFHHPTTFPFHQ